VHEGKRNHTIKKGSGGVSEKRGGGKGNPMIAATDGGGKREKKKIRSPDIWYERGEGEG